LFFLLPCAEILEKYFDVPRPWDFARTDLVQVVLQTSSGECVASDEETTTSSSGGGDGGGAASTGSAGGVLCFTESALVAMADGTRYKRIADVVVGDFVRTGTDHGQGLVTATLHHPVNRKVPVVIHVTNEYGALVGTPDHPVLVVDNQDNDEKGQWVAFGSLDGGTTTAVRFFFEEHYYVTTFYNLEIDGDQPGQSSHSYVVNGIVASGLGDNLVLNSMFPRQQETAWSTTVEASQQQ
jgi:hypothetical protein